MRYEIQNGQLFRIDNKSLSRIFDSLQKPVEKSKETWQSQVYDTFIDWAQDSQIDHLLFAKPVYQEDFASEEEHKKAYASASHAKTEDQPTMNEIERQEALLRALGLY
jgi:hypothetical protein